MLNSQRKVLEGLKQQLAQGNSSLTTAELAGQLNLSRSVTSHYLSQLLTDQLVVKESGRPVRWHLPNVQSTEPEAKTAFQGYVGANGSQKEIIKQCEAAVRYPGQGLNMLITGSSGVGKSYLAKKIFDYAQETNIIGTKAPFLVLNCADYANNPELLSSVLFGYVRGAFTGATEQRDGLLKDADGGFLFLDEVHRLSAENQEKLFTFMDTGSFWRLGDNGTAIQSRVRFIFATTESPSESMLNTFIRRVPVEISLPSYHERPVIEKIALIEQLFQCEARRVNRVLLVDPMTISGLLQLHPSGNIGRLKNQIRVAVACAYNEQFETTKIEIQPTYFSDLNTSQLKRQFAVPKMLIQPMLNEKTDMLADTDEFLLHLQQKIQMIFNHKWTSKEVNQLIQQQLHEQQVLLDEFERQQSVYVGKFLRIFKQVITEQFGLNVPQLNQLAACYLLAHQLPENVQQKALKAKLQQKLPRAYHVASQFIEQLPANLITSQAAIAIVTLLIAESVDERIGMHGLMIAHGQTTATSIQAVVNQLLGNYVIDALDMPIDSSVTEIVKATKQLVASVDTSNGFILMVDMGSLAQLYTELKHQLKGELLVINNLTTSVSLDIASKMQQGCPFKAIAENAYQHYTIDAQYFAGFTENQNIVISCMSGLGISQKIKEIMAPYFGKRVSLVTVEFQELQRAILQHDSDYFKSTLFVMSTTDLSGKLKIPSMNIYDILDRQGSRKFQKLLANQLSLADFNQLNQELLRFFSIEGVGDRLAFLNPQVVIKEVETVIYKYENLYRLDLDGKVKLNLYMHICLMIERLLTTKTSESEVVPDNLTHDAKEREFFQTSRSIFKPLEIKYNITLSDYELSLLYEVFKTLL